MIDIDKFKDTYQYDEREVLFMPNEIFDDFTSNMNGELSALAYTYYYLISWLYRYCKYGFHLTTQSEIRKLFSAGERFNAITKKNGILEQMGYIESDTDYPVHWQLDDHRNLEFEMLSNLLNGMNEENKKDYIERVGKSRNYKIKVPIKGLMREEDSDQYDGTFFDIANTHEMNIKVFLTCMSHKELGTIGFYIYGYLKYKCQTHEGYYRDSYDRIGDDLLLHHDTIKRYASKLVKYCLVEREDAEYFPFEKGSNVYRKKAYLYRC